MITYDDFIAHDKFPPTEEQRAVITSEHQATLVIAGAGSGKTATMANRIAWMLAAEVAQPQEILGLTFTRKAAGELADRVTKKIREITQHGLISPQTLTSNTDELDQCPENQAASLIHAGLNRPTMTTYNSFASQIATSYAMLIGEDPDARLMNEAERYQLMNDIVSGSQLHESLVKLSVDGVTRAALNTAAGLIDNDVTIVQARDSLQHEASAVDSVLQVRLSAKTTPEKNSVEYELYQRASKVFTRKPVLENLEGRLQILEFVERYFEAKKQRGLIEFSDQVAWATRILRSVPAVRDSIRAAFPVVLLDEFQDTSVNQATLLREAFKDARSVTAVGDPNQAIYGWRGASANAFADFVEQYEVSDDAQLSLTQAFRNSTEILNAANQLTFQKLSYDGLDVKKLRPGPSASAGEVVRIHRHYARDTYTALAQRLAHEIRHPDQGKTPSIAVLVRNHSFEDFVAQALDEVGVPYEVIGGRSIIVRPEIRAVRALLAVVDNPQRNDQLLYLMNFFGIGVSDLQQFSAVAEKYARNEQSQFVSEVREGKDAERAQLLEKELGRPEVSLIHALLAEEDFSQMSTAGQQRISYLADVVRQVQGQRHKPLSVLVSSAIDALDLHIYATTRFKGGAALKAALSEFIKLSGTFQAQEQTGQLSRFLEWIDLMEIHEHAGEITPASDLSLGEDIAPQAGLVQILTVNAAKGLEWDIVAVPELVEKRFDYRKRRYPFWHKNIDVFPELLRADAQHIPTFSAQDYVHYDEPRVAKCEALVDYGRYEQAVQQHSGDEERRLAYVAFTRPRRLLLLLTYEFGDEEKASKNFREAIEALEENTQNSIHNDHDEQIASPELSDRSMSQAQGAHSPLFFTNVFIEDLAGYVTPDENFEVPFSNEESFIEWGREQGLSAQEPSPSSPQTHGFDVLWPSSVDRAIEPVMGGIPVSQIDVEHVERVWHETFKRLCDDHFLPENKNQAVQRDYLTASDIVSLMGDAQQFYADQRRPIPQQISHAVRVGTSVHKAIAQHFDTILTLDIDSVMGSGEMPIARDAALEDKTVEKYIDRFKHSPFADLPHLAIEQALEIQIANYPVRCVIDAVFDTSDIPGGQPITIVDWKTGKRPTMEKIRERELQLGLYRLAWAQAHGVELETIDACFYYLGEDDPQNRAVYAGALSREQITAAILESLSSIG